MRDVATISPNASTLKALSHPLRLKMLAILRQHGPQTATTLAKRLDLNSGATSYHLRQLALHGLIEADETRGNRKDRWWKASHEMTEITPVTEDGELSAVSTEMLRAVLAHHARSASAALDGLPGETPEWQKAQSFNDFTIPMSATDAQALTDALLALLWQAKQNAPAPGDDLPDDWRHFTLHLHGFAAPGDEKS